MAGLVFDRIIDYCHDSPPTLCTCSLVSRAWLSSARLHLFKERHLLAAAEDGKETIVAFLLARPGINPNVKNKWGRTPLSQAALKGHERIVALLLARTDININVRDHSLGLSPLGFAVMKGHEAVVTLLLARPDVSADSRDNMKQTPLFMAVKRGAAGVVALLLAREDVEVDVTDCWGRTLRSLAEKRGARRGACALAGSVTGERMKLCKSYSESSGPVVPRDIFQCINSEY